MLTWKLATSYNKKMNDLKQASMIALRDCMGTKTGESILIVTDEVSRDIAQAFFESGKKLTQEVRIVIMPEQKFDGQEPPVPIAEIMQI